MPTDTERRLEALENPLLVTGGAVAGRVGPRAIVRGGARLAGAGLGDNATGVVALGAANKLGPSNDNLISGIDFYGGSGTAPGAQYVNEYIHPSDDVPFVVVRDNVCLAASLEANAAAAITVSIRMECALVTLGTDVLNQLLLTQTA